MTSNMKFVCAAVALLASSQARAQEWECGVGVEDVSPSADMIDSREVWLGGYGILGFRGDSIGFARGVHDPIEARAFAMVPGQAGEGVVVVVVDAVGMGNKLMSAIRSGISERTGLPSNHIFVSVTHTHSGPDLQGLWGGASARYIDLVVEGAVNAGIRAWTDREPAELRVSGESFPDENRNRRGHGFTDDEMVVLDAVSVDGTRIGTLINYAAHPVTMGTSQLELSGDYCGYARQAMEELTGAPVVFNNGAIGDVSPVVPPELGETDVVGQHQEERGDGRGSIVTDGMDSAELGALVLSLAAGETTREQVLEEYLSETHHQHQTADKEEPDFSRSERYGRKLAEDAYSTLSNHMAVNGTAVVLSTEYAEAVNNPAFLLAFGLGIMEDFYEVDLGDWSDISFETQVYYWRLGSEVQGVSFPGECLTRAALPVKEHMSAPHKAFLGLSGDTLGYFIPSDEWDYLNGYEEKVSINKHAGDNAVAHLVGLIESDQFSR